ncbi:MAG: serine/threonine protein kinase, partial [Bradymonadia bacterium]
MHIGPYRVLRVLARGGMGEVCLASLERPGGFRKLVALKRALPEFAADPAFSAMFQ